MPPPDLTCVSTKFDDCHRLTQRLSPPGLMTVSACPESKFRKHKSHSPPPQPNCALPKEGLWFNLSCFQTLHYTYIRGNKKTCKLYTKPYIQPYIPLIIRALRCVGFAFQTLHKAYINNTRILHSGGKNFTDRPRVKTEKCRV